MGNSGDYACEVILQIELSGSTGTEKTFYHVRRIYLYNHSFEDSVMVQRLNPCCLILFLFFFTSVFSRAADPEPVKTCFSILKTTHRLIREKKWDSALAEFKKTECIQNLPPHLTEELRELNARVNRLKDGKTMSDPTASQIPKPKCPKPGSLFYVSPGGSDKNTGTRDKPFATLARARNAVRERKKNKGLPAGGMAVILQPGTYPVSETLNLTKEDSGTAESPVVYRAEKPRTAVLNGGIRLSELKPVSDKHVLTRLPEASREKVRMVDFNARGITEFPEFNAHGFQLPVVPHIQLFFNSKPMPLSRWPNKGFVKTGKVLKGASPHRASSKTKWGKAVFQYTNNRPARWKKTHDKRMHGYWQHLWAEATLGIASIDTKSKQITAAHESPYGTGAGHPYYYLNILEEIDMPGEWYLDRVSGILYIYPPSNPASAIIELSISEQPFIRMDNTSHVIFENLVLELGCLHGIEINKGTNVLVAGCKIRKMGGDAVIIQNGKNHGVLSCHIHTMGRGGVRINAGDRKTLSPCNHYVENCHIHHFSGIDHTYTPAVWVKGVGTRISHNHIHHNSCHGLRVDGNNHLVQYNDIHDVVLESDDQGGLDTWGDPTFRGTVIRYNYWHKIGSGIGHCGKAGVRLDDAISGTVIYGNIFENCSQGNFGGVQIHGGKDNWVDNNVFIRCNIGISFSRWGQRKWIQTITKKFGAKVQAMNIKEPPYSTAYPDLSNLHKNADANRIWRNIFLQCRQTYRNDGKTQNMINNRVFQKDPGFTDLKQKKYGLSPESQLPEQTGFTPIPFDQIGQYQDAYIRPGE